MNFGFTGCHASVPRLQKLAVYAADALAELEAALHLAPGAARRSRQATGRAPLKRRAAPAGPAESVAAAPKRKRRARAG
jgi:hypothetical protein